MSETGKMIAIAKAFKPKVKPEDIESAVDGWLDENITNPDSPPLDRSLSSSSAAAPADIVGDLLSAVDDVISKCPNLFDGSMTTGEEVATSTGAFITNTGYKRTGYIPVKSGTVYIGVNDSSGNVGTHYCLYNTSKTKVSSGNIDNTSIVSVGSGSSTLRYISLTVTQEGYIAFDQSISITASCMVSQGDTPTGYVEYYEPRINPEMIFVDESLSTSGVPADSKAVGDALSNLDVETDTTLSVSGKPADAKVTGDNITKLSNEINDLLIQSSNTFDNSFTSGELATSTGAFVPSSTYSHSDYLPVKTGTVYIGIHHATNNVGTHYCLYDSSKQKLTSGNIVGNLEVTTVGSGDTLLRYVSLQVSQDGYVAFDVSAGLASQYYYVSQSVPTGYEAYFAPHIDTDYIVIDDTLTHEGLPADAKAVGDAISNLQTDATLSTSGKPADAKATGDAIEEMSNTLSGLVDICPNLYDGQYVEYEQVATSSGAFVDGNGYTRVKDHIPIKAGDVYVGINNNTQNLGAHYCLYNTSKQKLSSGNIDNSNLVTVGSGETLLRYIKYTAAQDGYIAFDFGRDTFHSYAGRMVSQGSAPTGYVAYFTSHINSSMIAVDDTLTKEGIPADAKATGEAIAEGIASVSSGNNAIVNTIRGGVLSTVTSASMTSGDGLYSVRNSIIRNKKITFKAEVSSSSWEIILANGTVDNTYDSNTYSNGFQITPTTVKRWSNGNDGANGTIDDTTAWTHGVTIEDRLFVEIAVDDMQIATVKIMSESGYAERTFGGITFWGCKGKAYAKIISGTFANAVLGFACSDITKPVWLFGDSYVSMTDNRFPYWLNQSGNDNALINAYPGEADTNAMLDLKSLLEIGTPRFVIWAQGMNDHDSSSSANSSWLSAVTELLEICEEKQITPILATIPNVANSSYNNVKKNAWVRASDERYIDFDGAIGAADEPGATWPTGWLSDDNVHPTQMGARVLAMQAILDAPELSQP